MTIDAVENFVNTIVAIPPSPEDTGTTLTVRTGDGSLLPTPPFDLTATPPATAPGKNVSEIVRVISVSGDEITDMTRATQESTAQNIGPGWVLQQGMTKGLITEIEAAISSGGGATGPTGPTGATGPTGPSGAPGGGGAGILSGSGDPNSGSVSSPFAGALYLDSSGATGLWISSYSGTGYWIPFGNSTTDYGLLVNNDFLRINLGSLYYADIDSVNGLILSLGSDNIVSLSPTPSDPNVAAIDPVSVGSVLLDSSSAKVWQNARGSVPATANASVLPSFPVTITTGVNDTFVFTPASTGIPDTFTISPGTYSDASAIVVAMSLAVNGSSVYFGNVGAPNQGASDPLNFILQPGYYGYAFNGSTVTEGNGGAAAMGITSTMTFEGGSPPIWVRQDIGGLAHVSMTLQTHDTLFSKSKDFALDPLALTGDGKDVLTASPVEGITGFAVATPGVTVTNVNVIADSFDVEAVLFVSDLAATQVATAQVSTLIPQGSSPGSATLDWTTATFNSISGSDLSFSSGGMYSSVGGYYLVSLYLLQCNYD